MIMMRTSLYTLTTFSAYRLNRFARNKGQITQSFQRQLTVSARFALAVALGHVRRFKARTTI